jgi:hypothetical protein
MTADPSGPYTQLDLPSLHIHGLLSWTSHTTCHEKIVGGFPRHRPGSVSPLNLVICLYIGIYRLLLYKQTYQFVRSPKFVCPRPLLGDLPRAKSRHRMLANRIHWPKPIQLSATHQPTYILVLKLHFRSSWESDGHTHKQPGSTERNIGNTRHTTSPEIMRYMLQRDKHD